MQAAPVSEIVTLSLVHVTPSTTSDVHIYHNCLIMHSKHYTQHYISYSCWIDMH